MIQSILLFELSSARLSFTWPCSFSSFRFSARLNRSLMSLLGRVAQARRLLDRVAGLDRQEDFFSLDYLNCRLYVEFYVFISYIEFYIFALYIWEIPFFRSSHRRCSVRKVFLEILQISQENACARISILIKLQALGLQLY